MWKQSGKRTLGGCAREDIKKQQHPQSWSVHPRH
jgi:hypothetical protein